MDRHTSPLNTRVGNDKVVLIGGIALVVLLFLGGFIFQKDQERSGVDWLAAGNWSHVPGIEITDQGIHIKPLGRAITHSDTSASQPNPAVNVRGAYLKVPGDFMLETTLSGVENGALIQLYGQVPVIYDEWRQERSRLEIEITSHRLSLRIWDGVSPSSIDERVFELPLENEVELALSHEANNISVRVGSKTLGDIPDHGIFDSGTVWLGANANLGTPGWTLHSISAHSLVKEPVRLIDEPDLSDVESQPDALRTLAQNHPRQLPIGAAISIYPLFTDEQYSQIALGQFSMMTPENSMKPQYLQPQKDLFTFNDADSLVEVAEKNDMLVHGHALVLAKANPEWMQLTPKKQRKQVMTSHIKNVVSHFRGRVAHWDVVNEPLSDDDIDYRSGNMGLRQHIWFDAMGDDYIDIALRTARAADPSTKLFINDYGLERDGQRWDALISLIKRLQARGVPIDGVGFEAHVYHEPDMINPRVLKRHIQILAGLGIESRISEIDVLGTDLKAQARQYAEVLEVCLSEPSCTSFGTWGITDLYGSTTLSDRYPPKLGNHLIWDATYAPRPALNSLRNVLRVD